MSLMDRSLTRLIEDAVHKKTSYETPQKQGTMKARYKVRYI